MNTKRWKSTYLVSYNRAYSFFMRTLTTTTYKKSEKAVKNSDAIPLHVS